jgi:hypothetical protein
MLLILYLFFVWQKQNLFNIRLKSKLYKDTILTNTNSSNIYGNSIIYHGSENQTLLFDFMLNKNKLALLNLLLCNYTSSIVKINLIDNFDNENVNDNNYIYISNITSGGLFKDWD